MTTLIFVIAAYLIGSISFAVVVSKVMGLSDPRTYGSGNPGATNVLRSGNKKAAIATLVGDALKGWVAVFLADRLADLRTVGGCRPGGQHRPQDLRRHGRREAGADGALRHHACCGPDVGERGHEPRCGGRCDGPGATSEEQHDGARIAPGGSPRGGRVEDRPIPQPSGRRGALDPFADAR